MVDTAESRRLIGKYVEVFQYPQGRIEIRVAGRALPYSLYTNSGTINHPGEKKTPWPQLPNASDELGLEAHHATIDVLSTQIERALSAQC